MGKLLFILTHYARRYMSNGMIHGQLSFCEIACALNKFWLVESWFLEIRSSGSRYMARWNNFRPIRIQDTGCILASDWTKIVPLCDVSAAAGPCIQKSTFNQSELFNACANSRNDRWTCIIPLDMYLRIACLRILLINIKISTLIWKYII